MKPTVVSLAAGALAVLVVVGCIIGDGDLTHDDPPVQCNSYPDDPEKCWQPWKGHILQECSEGEVLTRLFFARSGVPDSARTNIVEMGFVLIDTLQGGDVFLDTGIVCDGELCRNLAIKFRVLEYLFPRSTGAGEIEFRDSTEVVTDGGTLQVDNVAKVSCP